MIMPDEVQQWAEAWNTLLRLKFVDWLYTQKAIRYRGKRIDDLGALRSEFPKQWDQFFKTGLTQEERNQDAKIMRLLKRQPDNTVGDPLKVPQYAWNNFVDGKPPRR
jgi:hypothetical protein